MTFYLKWGVIGIKRKYFWPLVIGGIALVLVAFCVVFLWLPYHNAANALPENEPMQIQKQADGSMLLKWPVAEQADRYLVKVSDAADENTVYLEQMFADTVCTLPEIPENTNVQISVHSAKDYKMLWIPMERLCSNPLQATTQWELPDLEQVQWDVNADSKTAKLSYQKKTDARCKLYAQQEESGWFEVQDSQERTVIVQFGKGSIFTVPPVGQVLQFRAVAYRQEENLIFWGQTFEDLSVQRDDFLGRDLNPVYTDNGYNVCTITWDETKGERYQVQRLDDEDEWETLIEVPWDGERSYTSPHMPVNQTYTYRVVALGGQVMEGSEFAAVSSNIEQETKESPIYCTVWANQDLPVYKDAQKTEELGKIKAGSAWCVVEETNEMFGIYYAGQTAYVDSNLCFINLPEFMADMCSYNITNSYASMYLMHEFEIPLVSNVITAGYENVQLDETEFLVPLLYPTARKLADAARGAKEKGYRLKIYDAFRPQVATQEIFELTNSILDTPIPELPFTEKKTIEELNLPAPKKQIDPVTGLEVELPLTYREVMIVPPYNLDYFVAEGTSKHNYGIALDLTLEKRSNGEELEMQTSIHDLSHYSARDNNNNTANTLSSIMKKAGFTTLVSEWWHFNDLKSRDSFKAKPLKKGVSAKCWMVDDTGVRYRRNDGSYYKDKKVEIDGTTYQFDKQGYLITG